MIDVNIPIAFAAGMASFFAPCVIPLLPAYISYVTGFSVEQIKHEKRDHVRKRILSASVLYVLGFSIVFVILGSVAAGFSSVFRQNRELIQRIGGALILVLGVQYAGVFKLPKLKFSNGWANFQWINKLGYLRPFFVGVVFATVWSPCVGSILGSILALAAVTQTVAIGATMLFVYSLGISLPFLIVSLVLVNSPTVLTKITESSHKISIIAGFVLALLGVLLLTDTYKFFSAWLYEIFRNFGYNESNFK